MNRLQEPRRTALTRLTTAHGPALRSGGPHRGVPGTFPSGLPGGRRARLTGGLASIIRFARLAVTCTLATCLLLTLGAAVPAELGPGPGPVLPALTAAAAPTATAASCQEREPPRDVGHSHLRLRCAFADTRPLKTPDGSSQLYLDHRRARAATDPRGHDGRPRASRIRAVGDTRALLQVLRC
ncbi:hypothetical protein ACFY4C_21235 [Actinomadura viridis]|uniref:hypothetical protein n=1 Tax=Actinomadura viridis TaxID=58110 RepID=UPI00368DF797